ncbi:DNA methylase [Andreesenia angusta]|uniref:DNA methylase n=1 Tax=Andreesenia angusta TaxID=39480 RepID=A0A1S1V9V5_9FIRM|nr:DNA methyltransferase [Andreesenia angusta]OHW63401.1 DNA methylase [Andreesenia angusta]
MKLTKEDLDKVRHIEGFPIGEDEDIIALSNPPHYTACPNPFIEEFIKEHGKLYDEETDDYHREPFAADVSEGKNDPIYRAHTYHTKVPYKAIMRYILHYTKVGDIVFDGFCGTGMTGVAAQMCGNPDSDLEFKLRLEQEMPDLNWGERKAIMSDLAPMAQYIAYNYNSKLQIISFLEEGNRILAEVEKECGWMYETNHTDKSGNSFLGTLKEKGRINYTVWSDVFICPHCGEDIVYWNSAVDPKTKAVASSFICKNCGMKLSKRSCKNAMTTYYDQNLQTVQSISKQVPVLISYFYGGKRFEKTPDEDDIRLVEKIDSLNIPYWYPTDRMCEGSESRRNDKYGITHTHHFYTKRNLYILSSLYEKAKHSRFKIVLQSVNPTLISKLVRYNMGKRGNGVLSGTLYLPSLSAEGDIVKIVRGKLDDFAKVFSSISSFDSCILNNASSTDLSNILDNSVDYIFTDPPFGDNLNYSELSYIWECWLKIKTNTTTEAIVNAVQKKGIAEYQSLMTTCFTEFFRILKPNRWMTVEFHNSKNSVWNAIQESLSRAGFIIADVRTLDKKQGSFKQVTTTSAVKQDLVISAYKPKESFKREFLSHAGSEETAWDFVRQHLENLPVVVKKGDWIESVAERQAFLLFDRMVAYHIMNGIAIPLDASDFYKGLDAKFLKRDGMYFLHDQVNEYDTARITTDIENVQMEMFVSDEKSAIAWLYNQLETPQTYAEIQPKFMKEVRSLEKHEKLPELSVLLEENFLQDEAGKWFIPDVTKSGDIIKLREKRLVKEFEEYLDSKGKLKQFRTEAVRAGFAKLWKEKKYDLIVKTAERLPEKVIQEDDKLLMYYDVSLDRIE